jgi:hypothetical protein
MTMRRAAMILPILFLAFGASAAQAEQPPAVQLAQARTIDDVIAQLQNSGYQVEDISRTLLGRIRVVASDGQTRREIVMSRATGEIFQDRLSQISQTPANRAVGNSTPDVQTGADNGRGQNAGNRGNNNASGNSNTRGNSSSAPGRQNR